MRRRVSLMVGFLLLIVLTLPASAANRQLMVDQAGLLNQDQLEHLESLAWQVTEEYECDVILVTVNSLDGKDVQAYADDYFDYEGYGYGPEDDGVLFLIAMEEREWAISTHGFGIEAFNQKGMDYLVDQFIDDLSAGHYASAFETYFKTCDDLLDQARAGKPYGEAGFAWFLWLLIALAGGALLALIPMKHLKRQICNVNPQSGAASYVQPGSFCLTQEQDRFLYSNVRRTPRPQQNSGGSQGGTHRSSSGRSHGGSKGRF